VLGLIDIILERSRISTIILCMQVSLIITRSTLDGGLSYNLCMVIASMILALEIMKSHTKLCAYVF
jgi:hypothetical protein